MPDQLRFWERHVSLRRFAKEGFCLFRLTVFTRQCCIKNASQQWTSLDDVSNPVGNDGSRSPTIGPSGIMMRLSHLSGCQKSIAFRVRVFSAYKLRNLMTAPNGEALRFS